MYLVKDLLEGRGMAFRSRGAAHGEAGGRTCKEAHARGAEKAKG